MQTPTENQLILKLVGFQELEIRTPKAVLQYHGWTDAQVLYITRRIGNKEITESFIKEAGKPTRHYIKTKKVK